jgi:hypothetical protein
VALLSVRQGKSNIYQICRTQSPLGSKRDTNLAIDNQHHRVTGGADASDRANFDDK